MVSTANTPSAPSRSSSGLTTRDLINVGVFTAIFFVVMFVLGMAGLAGPAFMFAGHTLAILANGVVIALFIARVRKFGALTIMGVIVCGGMVAMGEPIYTLIGIPLAFLGDLIARTGNYLSALRNSLGYAVMSIWYVMPMLPIFFDSAGYRERMADVMNEDYATTFMDLVTPPVLGAWGVAVFVIALIGGLLGHRVLRRHFARAGLAK